MNTFTLFKEVWRGNSPFRAMMHQRLPSLKLFGTVLDLGSGHKQSYAHKMGYEGTITVKTIDQKGTSDAPPIDLENDLLPFGDRTADCVLMLNILEHIFDHKHALTEVYRVLKPGGTVIGFVPFFCPYHPGPRDFFRYTHEALARIFEQVGFRQKDMTITPIGFGPITAGFHLFFLSLPKRWRRSLRSILAVKFLFVILFDKLMQKWQKELVRDFPLGYQFIIRK